MTEGVPQFIQTIIILSVGGALIWILSLVAGVQRVFHEHKDFTETMASGSRDPKAKMETFKQRRTLSRNRATFIVIAILIVILLWLHQDH